MGCRLLKNGVQISCILLPGVQIVKVNPKLGGINSVSAEKVHDFEIICPAMGCIRAHPLHTCLYEN